MEMETDTEMETSSSGDGGMGVSIEQNQQPASRGNVMDLLARAQQLIKEGKPSLAVQALVLATKTEGGHEAVARVLQQDREMFLNQLQVNDAADQLASLFAECAIAEAQAEKSELPATSDSRGNPSGGTSMALDPKEKSILEENGREQVVCDAYLDGSSFFCLHCGGLVSNVRREEHLAYWCRGAT